MTRFYCCSCHKKRADKFKALTFGVIYDSLSHSVCVNCWENKFKCDKSKLISINLNYENIILNKKESS